MSRICSLSGLTPLRRLQSILHELISPSLSPAQADDQRPPSAPESILFTEVCSLPEPLMPPLPDFGARRMVYSEAVVLASAEDMFHAHFLML